MSLDLEQAGQIARTLGADEHDLHLERLSGGDIAEAWLIRSSDNQIFVKTLPTGRGGVLSSEADGLAALAEAGVVKVPRIYGRGLIEQTSWLALEFLELEKRNEHCDVRLGRALAELHRHSASHFGWKRHNFIGLIPQANPRLDSWDEFFLWYRLGEQLKRLDARHPDGNWARSLEALVKTWQRRFAHHRPPPALIHGDLWSGNAARLGSDTPVVFDPAVHYADRECELAMMRLFGGFDPALFAAYEEVWPLPEDHAERRPWYQCYHLLNHANLFGGAWLNRARDHIDTQLLH